MNLSTLNRRSLIAFGVPVTLILSIIFLTQTALFQAHSKELSIGLTFDLTLVIPFVYFLLIRKQNIPKITVVPFFIIGIVVASFVLPNEGQFYLSQIKQWLLPAVEITIFSIIVYKVRQLRKTFHQESSVNQDFFSAFKLAAEQVLPKKIIGPFATEIAVIYYGFIRWKKHKIQENEFTYHKESGSLALIYVIIFLIFVEATAIHLVLDRWSSLAAWILTILSLYSALQVFGFARAMNKRPIAIEDNQLLLRYGLFSESTIDLENIANVQVSTAEIELNDTTRKLSPLGELESHNVVIELNEETTLSGLYGKKSRYKTIVLHVDEKEEFVQALTEKLNHK